jgi:phospholipid-binding lipoprotein MlaA
MKLLFEVLNRDLQPDSHFLLQPAKPFSAVPVGFKNGYNMVMKHIFFLILLFTVFNCPLIVFAGGTPGSSGAIPDLLGEDTDADELIEERNAVPVYDPLEPMNRFFFEVNDKLYIWMVKPITRGYSKILPLELRQCLDNFLLNIRFPLNFLNSLLQGDMQTTAIVVERFLINSTLGVYGLVDVAAGEFDIAPRRADFGQTLGRWGVGEGIFIYWPVLGPSNVRDTCGLAADTFAQPLPYVYDDRFIDITIYSTEKINTLSLNPELYDDLKRYALDPYVAARQAYSDYRKGIINRQ